MSMKVLQKPLYDINRETFTKRNKLIETVHGF